jgi:23S rRNA pseudouridine2605 synthase
MAKKSASTSARPSRKKAAPEPAPEAEKPRAKKAEPAAKAKPAVARTKPKIAPVKTAKAAKPGTAAKSKVAAKSASTRPAANPKPKAKARKKAAAAREPALDSSLPTPHRVDYPVDNPVDYPVEDPIGDTTDGEGRYSTHSVDPESQAEMAAYRADTADEALGGTFESPAEPGSSAIVAELPAAPGPRGRPRSAKPAVAKTPPAQAQSTPDSAAAEPRTDEEHPAPPDAHLDRLQKILSQAGIASRRHAEEMIVAGRVMVNGQVITQLGAKADPARDHIRVDGKPIPAAERHRYFLLNKPRGYVTTVSDPEGRPTVMQFFSKMRERLYPVGRLDYESEGLLLVTNDGELANQLTRAASGVEKTYLVKIAGRPSEEELNRLRSGVFIERGGPGSGEAQTAPARIREFRSGAKSGSPRQGATPGAENPWYEVVLIEGRNRELRKMFQSVGHFVEKIRRVGYGPLVLDLPPGQMRELTPEELTQLRRAAEGKLRPAAKPERFDFPRKGQAGRSFEQRPKPEFAPRPEQRHERGFEKRESGKPDRFPGRREDRASADRRPAPRGREGRDFGARPAPSRPFSSAEGGERPFRKFDSGRAPGPGSRGPRSSPSLDRRPGASFDRRPGPRFDPRRSDGERARSYSADDRGPNPNQNRGPNRGRDRGPDQNSGRGFGRSFEGRPDPGPKRNVDRAFARGSKRPFIASRNDFVRSDAPADKERTNRPPSRFTADRGQPKRFDSGREEFRRSGPNRSGPNRSGPNRFGTARPGPDRSRSDRPGPDRRGQARQNPNRSGPSPLGPSRSGPNRSGPDRSVSGPPRSDRPRPDRPSSNRGEGRPFSARPGRGSGFRSQPRRGGNPPGGRRRG